MTERPPKKPETAPESVPSAEEVASIFKKLCGEGTYAETRRLEDDRGIYLWEIRVETEDGYAEYEYNRAGPNPRGNALQTAIYATFYGKDDLPISGYTVATCDKAVWNTELKDLKFDD